MTRASRVAPLGPGVWNHRRTDFPDSFFGRPGRLQNPDAMPAHLKASLLGSSVSIPITNGQLNMGTWQGIYLCEHRDHGGARRLVLTSSY
ncbi:YjbQ family protein [Kineobactrum salinum]|nr:YjbQ family protein [Kineobactrum salinum]